MPKVSILIPVYNAEQYIAKAIESIIRQTYSDWELIILDDCSTDNSYIIAKQFSAKDSRIKLYQNKKNLGMMENWNAGFQFCQSEYWAKLDADDYWHPHILNESIKILDAQQDVGLVCTKHINIDENGKFISGSESNPPDFARDNKISVNELVQLGPQKMYKYDIMRQGISLIRRKIFDEHGYFKLLDGGDTEMWFRIGCHYPIFFIDKTYYYYRKWACSFTAQSYREEYRAQKGFYDISQTIFKYYYRHGLLTKRKFTQFMLETKFLFNNYLIYRYREDGNYLEMLALLSNNFIHNPIKVIRFYSGRILKRH